MSKIYSMKKIIFGSLVGIFTMFLLVGFNSSYAMTLPPIDDNGNSIVNEETADLYFAGSTLTLNNNVAGDLTAAGQTMNINSQVITGSVNIAGQTMQLKTEGVGGSVRFAGQDAVVNGKIVGDVVMFGQTLTLENAHIYGDLVFFGQTLNIKDGVVVEGKFMGNYADSNKDLKDVVVGSVEIIESQQPTAEETRMGKVVMFVVGLFLWTIPMAILTLLLALILNRKKKLSNPENKCLLPNFKNVGIGFAAWVGSIAFFVVSLFTVPVVGVIYLISFVIFAILVTTVYAPIYVANVIKNQFNLKLGIGWMVVLAWLGLTLIALVPVVGGIVTSIFGLASLGYAMTQMFLAVFKKSE